MYFYQEHFEKGKNRGHGITSGKIGKCSGRFEEERFTLKMAMISKISFFFTKHNAQARA